MKFIIDVWPILLLSLICIIALIVITCRNNKIENNNYNDFFTELMRYSQIVNEEETEIFQSLLRKSISIYLVAFVISGLWLIAFFNTIFMIILLIVIATLLERITILIRFSRLKGIPLYKINSQDVKIYYSNYFSSSDDFSSSSYYKFSFHDSNKYFNTNKNIIPLIRKLKVLRKIATYHYEGYIFHNTIFIITKYD